MYEVFNYMTAETIGYVETEADAWYVVLNDSRPLDFLHWSEAETVTSSHPADDYEIYGENEF